MDSGGGHLTEEGEGDESQLSHLLYSTQQQEEVVVEVRFCKTVAAGEQLATIYYFFMHSILDILKTDYLPK